MRRLYVDENQSIEEVGQQLGRGSTTVWRHLRAAGVEIAPPNHMRHPHPGCIPHTETIRTIELYESGLSCIAVARVLGMSAAGVKRRLRHAGVQLRSRSEASTLASMHNPWRLCPETEQLVVVLYSLGVVVDEIAKWTGVARSTVTRVAKRNGLPLHHPLKQKAAVKPAPRVMRGGGVEKIDNTPLREAFEASSLLAGELAVRLNWFDRGRPDSSRVKRTLGVTPDVSRGKQQLRSMVDPETAALMADAMGLMPWEVGA